MEKNQYQKKKEADGYVVVEAAVFLPLASIFIVLLIGLCSYLYQGCFLMQAAYTVAFRSAAQERPDAGYADGQLNQLLEGEVLSFGKEERQIKAGMLRVEVTLERETTLDVSVPSCPIFFAITKQLTVLAEPSITIKAIRCSCV